MSADRYITLLIQRENTDRTYGIQYPIVLRDILGNFFTQYFAYK